MKTASMDDLAGFLTQLILGGAIEVGLEFIAGFTVLCWRFPGQPGDCLPLELEETCESSPVG
jgi:hypothetical protein